MKKLNKKGFTLAELLIVVAIIAVLVAISIPVFGTALNKAKVAADCANIRAGYAQVAVAVLDAEDTPADGAKYYLNTDGTIVVGTAAATSGTFETQGAPDDPQDIGGQPVAAWGVGDSVTYTYVADGTITITVA